ncbi:MAG: preprotein translocase subunit YajC [Alphaproteobacteria bacterium]|nr:preprotein translocase subunit YajC [Alphaproteobacteria bacterium]
MGSLAPIALMILVFYFLIMRPQQKREAKRRELINSVKRGDKVVTASGIIGVVHKIVSETEVSLEVSEGVRIRVLKNAISEVLAKSASIDEVKSEEPLQETKVDKTKKEKKPVAAAAKTKMSAVKKKNK